MADGTRGPDHVRLVMIKAMRALTRYAPKDYFARTPPAKSGTRHVALAPGSWLDRRRVARLPFPTSI
jgi:hypothetical protein